MDPKFENAMMKSIRDNLSGLAEYLPDDKKYIIDSLLEDWKKYLTAGPEKPSYWKGYKFQPRFYPETAKFAYEEMEYKENTVFVITFPKTGTTWVMEIARQMLYGHDEALYKLSKQITPDMSYLETGKAIKHEAISSLPLPRVLYGSHLPEELVNVEKIKKRKGKFIIVMRNPKDQAVSLYHFMQTSFFEVIREQIPSNWAGFLELYLQGKLPLTTKPGEWYLDNILGWYKHKNDENFLFIQYEDMKKDCNKELKRMATFLGVDISEKRLKEIEEATSFNAMKEKSNALFSTINMMRKGQVGSWKEIFTVAQSELMDKVIKEKIGDVDISFTYELN